jgi:Holliday junction resolvasome RuvABC endonuclease subunit
MCLDVGFRNMGVAIWSINAKKFVSTKVISTETDESLRYVAENNVRAIEHLVSRLGTIILERKPIAVIAEMPVGSSRNARAASCMSMAFAAVVSLCSLTGVPLRMVSPFEVKRMVDPAAGKKAVPKEKVIAYAKKRFGSSLLLNNAKDEHICDAMVAGAILFDEF